LGTLESLAEGSTCLDDSSIDREKRVLSDRKTILTKSVVGSKRARDEETLSDSVGVDLFGKVVLESLKVMKEIIQANQEFTLKAIDAISKLNEAQKE